MGGLLVLQQDVVTAADDKPALIERLFDSSPVINDGPSMEHDLDLAILQRRGALRSVCEDDEGRSRGVLCGVLEHGRGSDRIIVAGHLVGIP